MESLVKSMLDIEERAKIKIENANKMAQQMINTAESESLERIEAIKQKAQNSVDAIETQKKAEYDAIIEAQNCENEKRCTAMKQSFDENSERIAQDIFQSIIGGE